MPEYLIDDRFDLVPSPWNYPVVISLLPLVGAIAAGCPVVLKPSEVSANVSNALADLFPKYLDPSAYAVVKGAVPETSYLLSLKWDFILFTGSCEVGKVVASAAAKYVTPCALELGGASPAVIADDADLDLAAKRILWGYIFFANLRCRTQKRLTPPPQKETE